MYLSCYEYRRIGNKDIHTVGCELNISDAISFAGTLPEDEEAIVFNTCSFLDTKEKQSQLLVKLIKDLYPDKKMYIFGCDVNNNPSFYSKYDNIYTSEQSVEQINKYCNLSYKQNTKNIHIKVQDGCNYRCAFCIISSLRPKPFSIPYSKIKPLVESNLKNNQNITLILSGTELTLYKDPETGYTISQLLDHLLSDFPQLTYLGIPCVDPASNEIERIIDLNAKYKNAIGCLNLAVQAGNNTLLKVMRRRHTIERIREIHEYAKGKNIELRWDLVVGFPGETEELYNETKELVKELRPNFITALAYSPRYGTPAYSMSNQIPEEIKQKRVYELRSLCNTVNEIDINEYKQVFDIDTSDLYTLNLDNYDMLLEFLRSDNIYNTVYIKYNKDKAFVYDTYIDFIKKYKPNTKLLILLPDKNIMHSYITYYAGSRFEKIQFNNRYLLIP